MNPKIRLQAWSSIPVPSAMTDVQWVFFAKPYAPISSLSASKKCSSYHNCIGSLFPKTTANFESCELWVVGNKPGDGVPRLWNLLPSILWCTRGSWASTGLCGHGRREAFATACHLSNPSLRQSEKNSRKKSAHINSDLQFYSINAFFSGWNASIIELAD